MRHLLHLQKHKHQYSKISDLDTGAVAVECCGLAGLNIGLVLPAEMTAIE